MTEARLLASINIDDEIARISTCKDALAEETLADGHSEIRGATLARVRELVEWDKSADARPEPSLHQLVGHLNTLIQRLTTSDALGMPLTPPVRVLARAHRLHAELLLFASQSALENSPDEQATALSAAVLSSSEALAQAYAVNAVTRMVSPFWYACVVGTRGFPWNINGDSLALSTLVGLCRVAAVSAQKMETQDTLSISVARTVTSLLVVSLLSSASQAFLEATLQLNKEKPERVESTFKEVLGLIGVERRLVSLWVTAHTYETQLKPTLKQLGDTVAAVKATSEAQSIVEDAFTRPVEPYTAESLANTDTRDIALVKE